MPETHAFLALTPRQLACLALVAHGCTELETGRRLRIATATVRGHLARARARLNAQSTCQAVALTVAAGLIAIDHAERFGPPHCSALNTASEATPSPAPPLLPAKTAYL
jgi:DNA-binding CsgD family transcriptional regulator